MRTLREPQLDWTGSVQHLLHGAVKAAGQMVPIQPNAISAEADEQQRLQHVHPDGAAHAAEEDGGHDDQGDDRPADG